MVTSGGRLVRGSGLNRNDLSTCCSGRNVATSRQNQHATLGGRLPHESESVQVRSCRSVLLSRGEGWGRPTRIGPAAAGNRNRHGDPHAARALPPSPARDRVVLRACRARGRPGLALACPAPNGLSPTRCRCGAGETPMVHLAGHLWPCRTRSGIRKREGGFTNFGDAASPSDERW